MLIPALAMASKALPSVPGRSGPSSTVRSFIIVCMFDLLSRSPCVGDRDFEPPARGLKYSAACARQRGSASAGGVAPGIADRWLQEHSEGPYYRPSKEGLCGDLSEQFFL